MQHRNDRAGYKSLDRGDIEKNTEKMQTDGKGSKKSDEKMNGHSQQIAPRHPNALFEKQIFQRHEEDQIKTQTAAIKKQVNVKNRCNEVAILLILGYTIFC